MKTKLILLLIALLAPVSGMAQGLSQSLALYRYNLNSTTETYCVLGTERTSTGRVDTSGKSWTASSGLPFADVAVNDYVRAVQVPGSPQTESSVEVRTSDTEIAGAEANAPAGWPPFVYTTVSDAALYYRKVACGAGYEDGKISVAGASKISITFGIAQLDLTGGIDIRVACRNLGGAPWVQVFPALTPPALGPTYLNYTTSAQVLFESQGLYSDCRVGMKIGTADDGSGDLGEFAEQVSIFVTLWK